MIVYDRLLTQTISFDSLSSPIDFGRYQFYPAESKIVQNSVAVKFGDFLVPGFDAQSLVEYAGQQTKCQFVDNELLDNEISSLLKNTLLGLSEELDDFFVADDYYRVSTLLRDFDSRLVITPFEKVLQQKLFHLEEVCREPSYYLKREITKVNVARAKRVPVKAINYLAGHTEDWSRRRIRSVEPRRVLSEVVDYDLSIYENKVTANFVDQLLIYFSKRLNEIENIEVFIDKIKSIVESRQSDNSDQVKHWYKKLDRDFEKLGSTVNSITQSIERASSIKEYFIKVRNRLVALLPSELYTAVKGQNNLSLTSIKRTNLFDNHQHYRFVKILWGEFHKKKIKSIEEVSQEHQDLANAYIDYVWLVLMRSLLELKFTGTLDENGDYYQLDSDFMPSIKIRLSKDEKGIVNVNINQRKFSFHPVPATRPIKNISMPKDAYMVSLANTDWSSSALQVSPSAINSEEQVAKILFKAILETMFESYMWRLDSLAISRFKVLSFWLMSQKALVENRGRNNKLDLWLKRALLPKEVTALQQIIKEQSAALNARKDIRHKEEAQLKTIETSLLHGAKEHFSQYNRCVRCGQNVTIQIADKLTCQCSNKDCGVTYGVELKAQGAVFFSVPKADEIKTNIISDTADEKEALLDAFGFEML